MPGALALRLCPDILKKLSGGVRQKTIAVCGTNGKTTSNNVLRAILEANGMRVVCNRVGANMLPGVVTAYIESAGMTGKVSADYACLEIDEASAVKIFDFLTPEYIVITNLFRDQLDRYGEIDTTMAVLKKALAKTPDAVLILNGDDPLCASFHRTFTNRSYFFGIDEEVNAALRETKEGRFCVFCQHELRYRYYHYSQLGDYFCENCGFQRPALDFRAHQVRLDPWLNFMANEIQIHIRWMGFYNIYNILAAFSVASLLGLPLKNGNDILSAYKTQIGRMEEFCLRGIPVILNLSKNPAGFNQALSTMLQDPRRKGVVVAINDNAQDGKDISWIWDVDFERMAGEQGVRISSERSGRMAGERMPDARNAHNEGFIRFAASGIRAEDVLVRMKYAGIPLDVIIFEKDIQRAIETLLTNEYDVLYVLVNYTPLYETHRILSRLQRRLNGSAANQDRASVS